MMLTFKQTVQSPEGNVSISVFADEDKGHTVYVSQSGQLVVVEAEKRSSNKTKAAGFLMGDANCSTCDGC